MITNVVLPQWLDDLIFNELGAKYCRSNSDMTVIDWDRNDVLNYLGTYFPRSFAESYCIFQEYFARFTPQVLQKEELKIFDFGCGTGGEIVGMLLALNKLQTKPDKVKVFALDGNCDALRLSENVINRLKNEVTFEISYKPIPYTIEDFFDLDVLNVALHPPYDFVISFKAICEFVTKDRFNQQNPYENIVNFFTPKLAVGGSFILVDVTTYNGTSQEWLPKQMDKGLSACTVNVVSSNDGFNQIFHVSHSKKQNDISKVAWRIIL